MDVIDKSVNNKQFTQTTSLMEAHHNEPTLWDSNVNVMEEKELA